MITKDLSNPQAFLSAYDLWLVQYHGLERNTKCANRELHSFWLCCPAHRELLAEHEMLKAWAHYYDVTYNMYEQYGQYFSDVWLREFRTRIEKQ